MWEVRELNGAREVFIDTPVPMAYALREPETDWGNLGAVLMDMDGSSTDTERLVLEAMRQMMAEALGRPDFHFAPEDFPHIIGDSTTNHLTWLLPHCGISIERLQEHMANYYRKYHQTLRDIRDGKIHDTLIEPMPHLREFLAWAKGRGLKVGLVTSSLQLEVDIVMPEVFRGMAMDPDYRAFYDGVIAADQVGEPFLKPHPNLYILMLERLGVPARRALVIEDSTAGIVAGRLAGCSVAAVPHPHTRAHKFDEANLGMFAKGLVAVQERMEGMMG
jgi:beta-phosphoglucomutase-like phosphatase (HAD superfamily)